MPAAVQIGLLFGLIFSLFMCVIIVATLWLNPKIWAERAPEDIRQAVGPIDAQTRRLRRVFVILIFTGMSVILILSIFFLNQMQDGLSFWSVFLNIFILLMVWNLVDLVIIDWLLLVVIQPKFIIMPGTENLKSYMDMTYHTRGFLKGILLSLAAGLLFALLTMLVVWISALAG